MAMLRNTFVVRAAVAAVLGGGMAAQAEPPAGDPESIDLSQIIGSMGGISLPGVSTTTLADYKTVIEGMEPRRNCDRHSHTTLHSGEDLDDYEALDRRIMEDR